MILKSFLNTKAVKDVISIKSIYERKPVNLPQAQNNCELSKIKNGLVLCSLENNKPISNFGIVVRAGSRYESYKNDSIGITHLMRIISNLGTSKCSQIGLGRNLDHMGTSLIINANRDHVFYHLQCTRDKIEDAFRYLSYIITSPVYKHWEVKDSLYKLNFDIDLLNSEPSLSIVEDIHKIVFHNGLQNSLYAPPHMIGNYSCTKLRNFYNTYYNVSNTALIGVGLNHETLANLAYRHFAHYNNESSNDIIISPDSINASIESSNKLKKTNKLFYPGESRIITNDPLTYALLVSEGGSLMNTKEMLCFALLQNIMGVGPRVKYASLQTSGRLAKHCWNYKLNPILTPFSMTCYNANYTDTGLFGVYIICQPEYIDRLLRCSIDCFRELSGKNGISQEELATAKINMKSSYLMSMEDTNVFMEDLMLQTLMTHQVSSVEDIIKAIDDIEIEDVSKISKKLNAKCGLALRGNLKYAPYLDELLNQ